MTDPAEILRNLSPKMRFNVATAQATFDGGYVTSHYMHMREKRALRTRGLTVKHNLARERLTALGEAVRAEIRAEEARS